MFNGSHLEDFEMGEPFNSPVVDYWVDAALPEGGYWPIECDPRL